MSIKDALLPEYDHEMATTRRLLERVPEADLAWRPHEKSMTLGQLALHLANLPFWCRSVLDASSYDVANAGPESRLADPSTVKEILQRFDEHVPAARASLNQRTDPEMLAPWTLKQGSHEIFTLPRISAIRSFVMNHSIHHRGQLTVYLRLRNVPLPSIYGPTADEQ